MPRCDLHWPAGLAADRVALVHGNAAEVVLELLHRVENLVRPIADQGAQAPAGGGQKRETGPGLLIVDADIVFSIKRHSSYSFSTCPVVCPPEFWVESPPHLPQQSSFSKVRVLFQANSSAQDRAIPVKP